MRIGKWTISENEILDADGMDGAFTVGDLIAHIRKQTLIEVAESRALVDELKGADSRANATADVCWCGHGVRKYCACNKSAPSFRAHCDNCGGIMNGY